LFSNKLNNGIQIEKQILVVIDEDKRSLVEKLLSDTTKYTKGTQMNLYPLFMSKFANRRQAKRIR